MRKLWCPVGETLHSPSCPTELSSGTSLNDFCRSTCCKGDLNSGYDPARRLQGHNLAFLLFPICSVSFKGCLDPVGWPVTCAKENYSIAVCPFSVFLGCGNPVFLLLYFNFFWSLLAQSAKPRPVPAAAEANKACSVRGHAGTGVVDEFKELQINIFYDHPSTNYVPPWRPLVAGPCLQCSQRQGLKRRRPKRRSELRAPGLNFHLSNPGPAHWLQPRGPPRAAAPVRTCFPNSLNSFPAGWVGGPGHGSRRGGDSGGEVERRHWGAAGSVSLRMRPRKGTRPLYKYMHLRLRCRFAPLGHLYSPERKVRGCEFHQNVSLCTEKWKAH